MPEIIFTADDYGCYDAVDDGVIYAIKNGLINSVAAVANGPDAVERLKRLKPLENDVEIGCHITITSGKSLTNPNSFVKKNGHFRKFTQMRRNGNYTEARLKRIKSELRTEIMAQMAVFKTAGLRIKHLSSHHNSLTFFPEFLEVLIEIGRETGIKIRSANITPKEENRLFMLQLRVRSADNLSRGDIQEMKVFTQTSRAWLAAYKQTTANNPQPFPAMPDAIDGRNYGPLGIRKIRKAAIDRKAREKVKLLLEGISELDDDAQIEYCFHIAATKSPEDRPKSVVKLSDGSTYKGVDTMYFDSRLIELRALELLKESGNFPELSLWNAIT